MSKLDGYDEADKRRITNLMRQLVEGRIERGEIPCTDAAIKAAMPEAFETARATVKAREFRGDALVFREADVLAYGRACAAARDAEVERLEAEYERECGYVQKAHEELAELQAKLDALQGTFGISSVFSERDALSGEAKQLREALGKASLWLHAAYDRPPQTPECAAMLAAIDAAIASTETPSL